MKILIGYDGSETAGIAMKNLTGAGLPGKCEAIILLAITPVPQQGLTSSESIEVQGNPTVHAEMADEMLETAFRSLKRDFPDWKIGRESCLDIPARAILKRAEEWKPDLIVVGSHGWRSFGLLLIGSVAEKVMLHARGNVRIGKGQSRNPGPPRLIIGFDGSRESNFAVEAVAARQWPEGTMVKLLSVRDFQIRLDQLIEEIDPNAMPGSDVGTAWPWMEHRLEKAKEKLSQPGMDVEAEIILGEPRQVLLTQAENYRADAIFLGSRGLSGVKRFLLGSVSGAIASRSHCSVEICRISPIGYGNGKYGR